MKKRFYKKESDLLKAYREAFERAKYIHDTDEKLLAYNDVIRFCAYSQDCAEKPSVKRNQILFWTYNNIGDLFLQKNLYSFGQNNYLHALASYQNALEFSKTDDEQVEILKKMYDIYRKLNNKLEADKISSQLAQYIDDALKMETFLSLADSSQTKSEESYFLEQALKYVSKEKVSFLKQCQNTLYICKRLLDIYQKIEKRADVLRIQSVKEQTQKNIH